MTRREHGLALAVGLAIALATSPGGAGGPRDAGAPDGSTLAPREKLEGPKLDALLADIARARKDVRTLRAAFTQERRITLLATSVRSRGELTVAAPDRLRWELAAPDDVVYFVGPEGLTYRTRASSATIPREATNVARALGDLRALLTGDLAGLKDRWALTASRTAADVEIAGVAKDAGASLRAFTLVLEKGLTVPIRAHLVEGKKDAIDLVFANVVLNAPVDPARLRP